MLFQPVQITDNGQIGRDRVMITSRSHQDHDQDHDQNFPSTSSLN